MGQCILIGFLTMAALWLMFVAYSTGYQKGMEDLERDYEEIDKEFDDNYRQHRHGASNVADTWDIQPPQFLMPYIEDRD